VLHSGANKKEAKFLACVSALEAIANGSIAEPPPKVKLPPKEKVKSESMEVTEPAQQDTTLPIAEGGNDVS